MSRTAGVLFVFLSLGSASAPAAVVIEYDGSALPDSTQYSTQFNTRVDAGTGWTTNGTELTMSTLTGVAGIWFGNHFEAIYPNLAWDPGNSSEGNYISVRAKLGINSSGWNIEIYDDVYWARWELSSNKASYVTDTGSLAITDVTLDATDYHTYSIAMVDGIVRYTLDGTSYQGDAWDYGTTDNRAMFIGDTGSVSGGDSGSLIVDHVTIKSPSAIPEPSSFGLLSLALVGISTRAIRMRRTKRRTSVSPSQ